MLTSSGIGSCLLWLMPVAVACSHSERIPRPGGGIDPHASPDEVVRIVQAGETAYALTVEGRVHAWDLVSNTTTTLSRRQVHGLAADGSLAASVTTAWSGDRVIDIWRLADARTIASRRFDKDVSLLALSRSRVWLQKLGERAFGIGQGDPDPNPSIALSWDLATDAVTVLHAMDACPDSQVDVTPDGRRVICFKKASEARVIDVANNQSSAYHGEAARAASGAVPAKEAATSSPAKPAEQTAETFCAKCMPHRFEQDFLFSLAAAPTLPTIFVASRSDENPAGWWLDVWRPGHDDDHGGSGERLAMESGRVFDQILAVSPDAATIVTGGRRTRTAIRRPPGYAPEPLDRPSANAARFTTDGSRLITGHADGGLVLWDVKSLRQIAVAPK